MIRHKFGAKKTKVLGRKYGSKLEASYALRLEDLKNSGKILFYLEQVPFHLPGGTVYRLDFMEFWAPVEGVPGDIVFTECKGFDTPMGKLKIKQVKDVYGIDINVFKRS